MLSRIGLLLDMTLKDLERILYSIYVVLQPGLTPLKDRQLLSEDDYVKAQDEYGADSFTAMIGAEAIRDARRRSIWRRWRRICARRSSSRRRKLKPKKLAKRLKLIEAFTSPRISRNG